MKKVLKFFGVKVYPLSAKEQLKIKTDPFCRTDMYMDLSDIRPGDIIEHESTMTLIFTEPHIDGANCYGKGFDPSLPHCSFMKIIDSKIISNCVKLV